MADANLIAGSCESVSLHLLAIQRLGEVLTGVTDSGGTRAFPYDLCLAFSLLAESAQSKLDVVDRGITEMISLKRDMDRLAREAGGCANSVKGA